MDSSSHQFEVLFTLMDFLYENAYLSMQFRPSSTKKMFEKADENERAIIVDDGRELIGLDRARVGFCGTYLTLTKMTQMRCYTSGIGLFFILSMVMHQMVEQ